jgi:hypothetical protein
MMTGSQVEAYHNLYSHLQLLYDEESLMRHLIIHQKFDIFNVDQIELKEVGSIFF